MRPMSFYLVAGGLATPSGASELVKKLDAYEEELGKTLGQTSDANASASSPLMPLVSFPQTILCKPCFRI